MKNMKVYVAIIIKIITIMNMLKMKKVLLLNILCFLNL